MEKNNLSDTPIEEYILEEFKTHIEEESNAWIAGRLKPASKCRIYRVPRNLRRIKQEAYTPQLISIGPFHHGNEAMADMEKQKIRYKEDFGKRLNITKEEWQDLINFIKVREQDIRDCYDEERSYLSSVEFIRMILYDAIFIIELFLKNDEGTQDSLLNNASSLSGIRSDLQLIENQIPFFVLKDLYDYLPRHPEVSALPSFESLCSEFFEVTYEGEFQHFVDLRRNFLVKKLQRPEEVGRVDDLPSAVRLYKSGVKFETIKGYESLLDIKLRRSFFKVDKLQIPRIKIDDTTECLFHNMMALEQCHYSSETHICNYVKLIGFLIKTETDAELLIEKEIISSSVGDRYRVADMFNELCLQITTSDSCYKDICEDLKNKTWWNRTKAWWYFTMTILMGVYFSNLWRGTATIAAVILLVLTLLQTIYTMKG